MRLVVVQICAAALASAVIVNSGFSQDRLPIIDVHLHDMRSLWVGNTPRPPRCPHTPTRGLMYEDGEPVCDDPLPAAGSVEALRDQTLEVMRQLNITAVVCARETATHEEWEQALPGRIIPGFWTADPNFDTPDLRKKVKEGHIKVLGEISTQYRGVAPDDPLLEPLYALAEELDVPVAIHVAGIGGASPRFRARLGDPLLLEEPLSRHPNLRLWVMHAGYPFKGHMVSLLGRYPNVYVDIGVIDWLMPRSAFYEHLKYLIDHGFGKRIMFGTDQMYWPGAIEEAIKTIEEAPFLSESQKRDIFYNNAARFLKLDRTD